jgi:hypothetical protein
MPELNCDVYTFYNSTVNTVVQRLTLALTNGPKWLGLMVPLMTEKDPASET